MNVDVNQTAAIRIQAFQWARPYLEELCLDVRVAVEAWAESEQGGELKPAHGASSRLADSLAMLGAPGAARLAEAVALASEALSLETDGDRQSSASVMLEAMAVLPDYLERIEARGVDASGALLPLINDLRALAGKSVLDETDFFQPELVGVTPPPPGASADASELRRDYQRGLHEWLVDGGNADQLHDALVRIRDAANWPDSLRRLGWAAAAVSRGIADDRVRAGPAANRLFARLDILLKRLAEETPVEHLDEEIDELSRHFLFQAVTAVPGNQEIQALVDAFGISGMLPDEIDLEQARGAISGLNRSLFVAVAGAAREDLERIKEAIDLELESEQPEPGKLEQQSALLHAVGNSLAMLGLERLSERTRAQSGRLRELTANPDDPAVLEVARELLLIESGLDDAIQNLGESQPDSMDDQPGTLLPRTEQRRILCQLIREALDELVQAKHLLDALNRKESEKGAAYQAYTLLMRTAGALAAGGLDEVAGLIDSCALCVEHEFRQSPEAPSQDRLDALAEALTVTEIYLESLVRMEDRGVDYLAQAQDRLDQLGFRPELPAAEAHGDAGEAHSEPTDTALPEMPAETAQPDDELAELFVEELDQELAGMHSALADLTDRPDDRDALTALRRSFHTLKGAGNIVGAVEVGEFCARFEDLLDKALEGSGGIDVYALVPLLDEAVQALPAMRGRFLGQDDALDDGALAALVEWARRVGESGAATIAAPETEGLDPTLIRLMIKELSENLKALDAWLSESENRDWAEPVDQDLIRAVHTMKGTLRLAPVGDEAETMQTCEDYLQELHDNGAGPDSAGLEAIHGVRSLLMHRLERLRGRQVADERFATGDLALILRGLVSALHEDLEEVAVEEPEELADTTMEEPEDQVEEEPAITAGEEAAAGAEQAEPATAEEPEPPAPDELAAPVEEEQRVEAGEVEEEAVAGAEQAAPEATEEAEIPAPEESAQPAEEEPRPEAGEVGEEAVAGAAQAVPEATEEAEIPAPEESAPPAEEELRTEAGEVGEEAVADAAITAGQASPAPTADVGPQPEQPAWLVLDYSELDGELVALFLDEAGDLLEHTDHLIQEWRNNLADRNLVTAIQRDLHTIKGSARMAGLNPVGEVAHVLEELLEAIAGGGREATATTIDALESGCDYLHDMFAAIEARKILPERNLEELLPEDDTSIPVADLLPGAAQAARETTIMAGRAQALRVPPELVEDLINFSGEISIFRSRLEQQVSTFRSNITEVDETVTRLREQLRRLELETEAQILSRHQREFTSEDSAFDPLELDRYSTIQQLSRALSESVGDLNSLTEILDAAVRESESLLTQQARVTTDLQEGLMRARLVSFNTLVPRLKRVVRNAARDADRQVELFVDLEGEGELDRNVLDRITAPLEHMLRNAVAHGIETPKKRSKKGKDPTGNIRISVGREATEMLIRIEDDGAGLDMKAIRARGMDLGLITADQKLDDDQVARLIFETGFSTAKELSELAGRGVGMDVVTSEVRQIGGAIQVHSEPGAGTSFTIRIPLSLAVMQVILVQAGERTVAIPLQAVRGVARVTPEAWSEAVSGDTGFEYAGETYPLMELEAQLGLPPPDSTGESLTLLMVQIGEQQAAMRIARLLGHREVAIKPVGPQISSIPGILAGTITGDGQVVLVLDMGPLIRRALAEERLPARGEMIRGAAADTEAKRIPLILVVDDSITIRRVTTRVLEQHGLEVLTARDGLDAIEMMYEHIPDGILLDIEMPRMDGFELADHVRKDPRLKHVPIMMITSRTGEKHRQHARELGVERYLTKPYQEAELVRNTLELLDLPVPEM